MKQFKAQAVEMQPVSSTSVGFRKRLVFFMNLVAISFSLVACKFSSSSEEALPPESNQSPKSIESGGDDKQSTSGLISCNGYSVWPFYSTKLTLPNNIGFTPKCIRADFKPKNSDVSTISIEIWDYMPYKKFNKGSYLTIDWYPRKAGRQLPEIGKKYNAEERSNKSPARISFSGEGDGSNRRIFWRHWEETWIIFHKLPVEEDKGTIEVEFNLPFESEEGVANSEYIRGRFSAPVAPAIPYDIDPRSRKDWPPIPVPAN